MKNHFRTAALVAGFTSAALWLLQGCTHLDHKTATGHLATSEIRSPSIPGPVTAIPVLPPPQPVKQEETFSVVVTGVPLNELLFALARDAGANIDIHPGVSGNVTLNAIDQTLTQILERIAAQVPIRYRFEDRLLIIEPDLPYLYTYRIDYVNLSRSSKSQNSVATQIATTGQGGGESETESGGNSSVTAVESSTDNLFWESLRINITSILGEDTQAGTDAGNSKNVIISRETGLLTVRASQREHRIIQEFVDQLMTSAQRQVLIEATVVEVELSNQYQFGVDWSRLSNDATGFNINQNLLGTTLSGPPRVVVNYATDSNTFGNISTTLRMLEQFGNVKVLSSPKIMAINNQTALLKVVDNVVYFTIEADTTQNDNTTLTTFTTTPHTIPVGFVMSVTPQISKAEAVTLNVRPTISRVTGFVRDPNPSIANADLESLVPQIQVREMESVLQIQSGQLAVLGGLIQDSVDLSDAGVPGTSNIQGVGDLLTLRDNTRKKSELVVFLRPRVISGSEFPQDIYSDYLPSAGEPFAPRRASDRGSWR